MKVIAVTLPHAGAAEVVSAARAVPGALVRLSVPPGTDPGSFADLDIPPGHVTERREDASDAGARAVFADLFRRGARQVLLVGAAAPPPPSSAFEDAFSALATNPSHVVLGPVSDGGCYLLGLSAPTVPDLFTGVRRGTRYALMDMLRRCEFEERRVTFLPMLEVS